jgi:hypothetical protein
VLGEVSRGVGVKEVTRHYHDGGVVDVAEQVHELSSRATGQVGGRREREIAHHVDVVAIGNGVSSSFSGGHAFQSRRDER